MKQVLRFNKVIKLIIIAGDLCILNTIFIVLYHIIDVQTLGETFANSLSRLLVLLNLVYITCNYSKGIILHERIAFTSLFLSDGLDYEVDPNVYGIYKVDGSTLTILDYVGEDENFLGMYPLTFTKAG